MHKHGKYILNTISSPECDRYKNRIFHRIYSDFLSRYAPIDFGGSLSTTMVLLKVIIPRYGLPSSIQSDNRSSFTAEVT